MVVSLTVALKLGLPIMLIGLRQATMLRTGMPEAAVDEDSDLLSSKYEIGTHTNVLRGDWVVSSIAEPLPMEHGPDFDLRSCVSPLVTATHGAGSRTRRAVEAAHDEAEYGPRKRWPSKWIRWSGSDAIQTSVSHEISCIHLR
jgi:hypothetical protein